MTTIQRLVAYDPWSVMDDLIGWQSEFNRFFEDRGWGRRRGYPAINAWIKEDEIVLDVELPGVEAKDVEITVTGERVILAGKRETEDAKPGETLHRRERAHGAFSRALDLPFKVEPDQTKATFKNGMLRIVMPRRAADRPRRVAIQAA